MGLFTTAPNPQPTHTNAAPSPDGAFEAPNRVSRAQCWAARDNFFACLERNDIVDSIREKEKADTLCGTEGKGLERECAASWVCEILFLDSDVVMRSQEEGEGESFENKRPRRSGLVSPFFFCGDEV